MTSCLAPVDLGARRGRKARFNGVPWRTRDELVLEGNVAIDIVEADGTSRRWEEGPNLVVTDGRNLIRDFLATSAVTGLTRFRLGTDASLVNSGQTALGAQVLDAAITQYTKAAGQLVVQYYLNTSTLNGTTIREAGLFTALNTMYARYVLSAAIVKTSAIAVVFTWTLNWTSSGMSINIEVGSMVEFDGAGDIFVRPSSGNVYPAGATYDKLVPNSGVWYLNSSDLPGGSSFVLEAVVKIEAAGAVPKIGLFNLDDGAPNTVLAGSEVSGAGSTTGERVRSSVISFPAGGVAKTLGVKVTTNNVAIGAAVYGIRAIRTA